MVVAQVRAVVEDLGVDAVKVGMLGSAVTTRAVADALDLLPPGHAGRRGPGHGRRVRARGCSRRTPSMALVALILPRATVVTPNLPEARVLAGDAAGALTPAGLAEAILAARARGAVLVTGGHREEATDLLADGRTLLELPGERHPDGAAHGSGCTHSVDARRAPRARARRSPDAARAARAAAAAAVRDGLRGLGRAPGRSTCWGPGGRRRTRGTGGADRGAGGGTRREAP